MKTRKLPLIAMMLLLYVAQGQQAKIYEQQTVLKTYPFSDPNPVPDMDMNYPYFRYDGFTNTGKDQEWNMVVLENDYIKVFVNPAVGGKIWGAIEKSTGKEFLYYNHVVKFRDVAQRGPWTSGGLEFNYGYIGHTSTCSTPQNYVLKENADGSVSCVIGAIDLHTHAQWNVEIKLEKDKAYVETISSCFNTGSLPETYYHYSNAAAKSDGDLEFILPGDHYIGHERIVSDWPIEDGRKISWYKNNDFGGPKSYHVVNSIAGYMGGYYHDEDFGFGNLHDFGVMPGKKLWIWGLSEEGMIWENLLTDTDGQYIEWQTGGTFNQAEEGSGMTPFKHREIVPYDTDISSELYFPLVGTGGMVTSNKNAVLNVIPKEGNKIEIRLSPLAPLQGNVVVRSGNTVLSTEAVNLKPLELYTTAVDLGSDNDFEIEVGDHLLSYSSKDPEALVERPLHPNADFDWDSAEGLFTKGYEMEKQYGYIREGNARKAAKELYKQALELDPAYAPALRRMAFAAYRSMNYQEALSFVDRALAIDTYDPEANYLFGLLNVALGKTNAAQSGFLIAAQSTTYRAAALTELAKLQMRQKNWNAAMATVEKALDYNRKNLVGLELQELLYRIQGQKPKAEEALQALYLLDNTNPFVAYEAQVLGMQGYKSLDQLITNELSAESYIDLALKYQAVGQLEDAVAILKKSPADAKVYLLLAHWDASNREVWLQKGLAMSPSLVFPFRTETYNALTTLMKENADWKLKYYAALVLWKKDRSGEAKELFQQCGDQPRFAPFYLSKAKLFAEDVNMVDASLKRAAQLDPNDWRVQLAQINRLMETGQYTAAAKIAKKAYASNPDNSLMGIRYAGALLKAQQYKQALSFLEGLVIIPFEGAVEGRSIYHEAAIRLAYGALKKGNYKEAITYAEKAKQWPTNLGTGEPYNADLRLENSILAFCATQLGQQEKAMKYAKKIAAYRLDKDDAENAALYLQVLALQQMGAKDSVADLLQEAQAREKDNPYVAWSKAMADKESSPPEKTKTLKAQNEGHPLDNSFLLVQDFLDISNTVNP